MQHKVFSYPAGGSVNWFKKKKKLFWKTVSHYLLKLKTHISSVQLLSHVWLFATPGIAAHQASLSITNSWSLLKLMSIESVMPSKHLILCHPLLPPSIFPSIRFFSNESALRIRWLKYWSFSFSISPSNEYSDTYTQGFNHFSPLKTQQKGLHTCAQKDMNKHI